MTVKPKFVTAHNKWKRHNNVREDFKVMREFLAGARSHAFGEDAKATSDDVMTLIALLEQYLTPSHRESLRAHWASQPKSNNPHTRQHQVPLQEETV